MEDGHDALKAVIDDYNGEFLLYHGDDEADWPYLLCGPEQPDQRCLPILSPNQVVERYKEKEGDEDKVDYQDQTGLLLRSYS